MSLSRSDEVRQIIDQAMQAAQHEAAAGHLDQASALYQAVFALQPGHAGAHHALGLLALQAGELAAAIPHFAAALEADPGVEAHWLAYLATLIEARQFVTAGELLALARRHGLAADLLDPVEAQLASIGAPQAEDIDAAVLLFSQGRLAEATDAAQALIERFPQHPFGWKLLGGVLHLQGKLEPALHAMHTAMTHAPDDAETLSNLGLLLLKSEHLADAEQVLRRAVALAPDNVNAHSHLANTLLNRGQLDAAEAGAGTALALDPAHVEASSTLAMALQQLGRPLEAVEVYRRLLAREDGHADIHSNLLFCMSQMSEIGPAELFAEHRRYGERVEAQVSRHAAWDNAPDPQRTLRIGFVSADLRNHAVANFIGPIFERLADRPGMILYAYYNHPRHDHCTDRLRGHIAHWRDVIGLDDAALDARIRADGIDILFDLGGHTSENRLPLFARKPAPLQVTWMGYPGTTGLTAMDYWLADLQFLPPGRFDHLFTEKLVQMPLCVPFQPYASAPEVGALPALANGYITFGSFNRLSKFNRSVVAAWARLLRAMPDARLLVGGMPEQDDHRMLRAWLEHEGVAAARVTFHGRMDMPDYLALHQQVDLCLDTFPYSGGTTTMHAGWMGVPTLTLAGGTMPGRQTASCLEHWGLPQFIAHDADDFLARGLAVCADLPALAALRATLRSRFRTASSDGMTEVADGVEDALRLMWQRWCQGLAPASFAVPARLA